MKKAIIYRSLSEIKCMLLCMSGFFLFGTVLCFLVMETASDDSVVTSAMIASFLAWIGAVIVVIFYGGIGMKSDFNLAVCMSHSRKYFLAEEGIVSMLSMIASVLFFLLLSYIDLFILSNVYADVPIDSEMDMRVLVSFLLKSPVNLLCLLAVALALRFLFGIIYMRFGQWTMAVIWVLMLTGSRAVKGIAGSPAAGGTQIETSLSVLAARMNGQFFQVIAIIISLALIAVSVLLLGRQEVKNC